MKILIVTPAPAGARSGNRVTALRWAAMLRALGHRVALRVDFVDEECDLLIALHARKSAGAVMRFRAAHPARPVIVGLAGTDLYPEPPEEALRALDAAWRIVALQPRAVEALPPSLRGRLRPIVQSARAPAGAPRPRDDAFAVTVLAHLREVKDPFLAARAARLLPPSSRVRIDHFGAALSTEMAERARDEAAASPRWSWHGDRPRREALSSLAASRLLVVTSRSEGGANVVSEAIACGVPVLSTRIEGSIGVLGEDHPGLFPVGDAAALAALLARAESDGAFYRALVERSRALAERVRPERERDDWRALLDELAPARRLTTVDAAVPPADFARDVVEGLSASPRRLACRWFYDDAGSRLFEEITRLPEYYLPRAEREILAAHADAIVARLPPGAALVELGSGGAHKTRLLLDALYRRQPRVCFLPVDISRAALDESAAALLADYPTLELVAICAEYRDALAALRPRAVGPKLVAWLGSNIGNFTRPEAAAFLRGLAPLLDEGDRLLVGVDLRKPRAALEPAYDDARGVTAAFNRNLLARINRELGGDFPVEEWRHHAPYDEREGRIDMYLVSPRAHTVRLAKMERSFHFDAGERIHTECSYKYSLAEIDRLAAVAGYRVDARFLDGEERFAEILLALVRG